jgi:hypothetical protein
MDIEVTMKNEDIPEELPMRMEVKDKKEEENPLVEGASPRSPGPTPGPTPGGNRVDKEKKRYFDGFGLAAAEGAKDKDLPQTAAKLLPSQRADKPSANDSKKGDSGQGLAGSQEIKLELTDITKVRKNGGPVESKEGGGSLMITKDKAHEELEIKQEKSVHDISGLADVPEEMNTLKQGKEKDEPRQIATMRVGSMTHFEAASRVTSNAVSMHDYMSPNIAKGKPREKKKGDEDEKKKSGFSLKGLALFSRFASKRETFTYEDYDTDPDENLSVIPEYMKNRETITTPLETTDIIAKSSICAIPIKRGQTRGMSKKLFHDTPLTGDVQQVATLKCVFVPERAAEETKIEKCKTFMTKAKQYVLGVYVLRGIELIPSNGDAKPDTYLKIFHGDTELDDAEKSLRKETNSPEYYRAYKFQVKLPGPASIRIEIWQDILGSDELLGYTEMDMENRFFSKSWLGLRRKPVETRIIKAEGGERSVGRLECFAELYKDPKQKIWDVAPLPSLEYELRVIVWKTRDTVFKDEAEKCNDLFVRGGPAQQEFLETDTHWRCRAEGSFNWRWKFKMMLPLKKEDYGGDRFVVQIWDRDISAPNDLIGECDISLNIHRMLDKAYKRQKAVKMSRRWVESDGLLTDRLWFDVYHPEVFDDQGNKKSQVLRHRLHVCNIIS